MSVIKKQTVISLPARVSFGGNFLRLPPDVTDEEIAHAASQMNRIAEAWQWWLGDLLNQVEEQKGTARYAEIAAAMGVGYRTATECKRVCKLVEQCNRLQSSTFGHHREALAQTGKVDESLKWVKKSAKEGWSVDQMRARIVESHRAAAKTSASLRPARDYSAFYRATKEVSRIQIDELPEDERETLRDDLRPLRDWLGRLWGTPGKESL